MRENGANDQEIGEFKKLKKYSDQHRLRHVYRQFNDFKWKLNESIVGFSDTERITEWNRNFKYEEYLQKKEAEDAEKLDAKETLEAKTELRKQ